MRPNDYDAHLGLALALRGQIDDSNFDKKVAAVQARARRLQEARRRPPRHLLQRGRSSPRSTRRRAPAAPTRPSPCYQQAKSIFQTFIDKASRQARVRRRGEALEGADAGHRRHHQVHPEPADRAQAAAGRPAAAAAGGRGASGARAAARRTGAGEMRRRPQPRTAPRSDGGALRPPRLAKSRATPEALRHMREPWVVALSRRSSVTMNRVDPSASGYVH